MYLSMRVAVLTDSDYQLPLAVQISMPCILNPRFTRLCLCSIKHVVLPWSTTYGASHFFLTPVQHAAITALELGPGGGEPVKKMLHAYQDRRVGG